MFGLGKERTSFGKWLDKRGISQEWVVRETKLKEALRKIDPNIKQDDFWVFLYL